MRKNINKECSTIKINYFPVFRNEYVIYNYILKTVRGVFEFFFKTNHTKNILKLFILTQSVTYLHLCCY